MRPFILIPLLCSLLLAAPANGKRRGKKKAKGKPAAAAKNPDKLDCVDPDTDEKFTVSIKRTKKALKALPKRLNKMQVHLLDLSLDARERRQALPRSVAAGDWCLTSSHLQNIEDALGIVQVDQTFVSEKFTRVERWLRSGDFDEARKKEAGRLLAIVGVELSGDDPKKANKMLNTCIAKLFGGTLWDAPQRLPEPQQGEAGAERAEIKSWEVEEACPKLAQKGRGNRSDLELVEGRLRKMLDERHIRVDDLEGGPALVTDMASYKDLDAHWPAIRVACVMLLKAKQTEVDLGFIMARFHRITKTRQKRELGEAEDKAFRLLVRASSEAISKRDFDTAHDKLEELLVFLGEPSSPSATLDRNAKQGESKSPSDDSAESEAPEEPQATESQE